MTDQMFAKRVYVGSACIAPVSVQMLERHIRQMDGQGVDLVLIEGNSESVHMAVGGGRDAYVVYATFDNQRFFTLHRRGASGGPPRAVRAGGQVGEYNASQCLDFELVLQAVTAFAERGALDARLDWRES